MLRERKEREGGGAIDREIMRERERERERERKGDRQTRADRREAERGRVGREKKGIQSRKSEIVTDTVTALQKEGHRY